MKHIVRIILFMCIGILLFVSCSRMDKSEIRGPYFGQTPPGPQPELYAPGIVSTQYHEHSFPAFSSDGNEVFWTRMLRSNYIYRFPELTLTMEQENGTWSEIKLAPTISRMKGGEVSFSPDGLKLFFSSTQNAVEVDGRTKFDIWTAERSSDGWSDFKALGPSINTEHHEMQPTVSSNGTLYYVGHYAGGKNKYGIYRAEWNGESYNAPELLPLSINTEHVEWTPYISPDEDYLLFSSLRPGGYGSGDIYVTFRSEDGDWTDPVNLGPTINEHYNERYPYVSPDGKYLFFLSDKVDDGLLESDLSTYDILMEYYENPGNGFCDVYWVDASIIEEKRVEVLGESRGNGQ